MQISLHSRRSNGQERLVSVIDIAPEFAARYTLGRVLGTGAMGQVFEGVRAADATPCAVKFLTRLGDPEILARFLQEGRLLGRMTHPSVVRLLEMDTMQGHPYLVTEHLPGGTLRDRLTSAGRLPVAAAVELALQCLSALAACHLSDVVHRDVKPENVMFDGAGRMRLVDFGIAKAYGQDSHTTRAGVLIGTPRYMAPELLRGGRPTVQGDIYALGCVLYESVTGRPPFPQLTMAELLPRIMNSRPPPMAETAPDVPAWLEEIVLRALSKNAADRFATADELAAALAEGARTLAPEPPAPSLPEPVVSRPDGPVVDANSPDAIRLPRRRALPVPALALVIVLLVLLALGALAAFGQPKLSGRSAGERAAAFRSSPISSRREPRAGQPAPAIVVIDPGHPSEVSDGATVLNGVTEVHVAWEVAKLLEGELEAAGVKVIQTKARERELVKNRRRAEIANEAGAALMVRLHCDAAAGSGFALYHPDRTGRTQGVTGPSADVIAESGRAARALHAGMAPALAGWLVDGGVRGDSKTFIGGKQGALTGSIFSQVPVVTIEMVVLTNRGDAAKIRTAAGQTRMAQAIARGVLGYVRPPPAPAASAAAPGAGSRAAPAATPPPR